MDAQCASCEDMIQEGQGRYTVGKNTFCSLRCMNDFNEVKITFHQTSPQDWHNTCFETTEPLAQFF